MKVKINNSVTSVEVPCKRSTFVAELKADYLQHEGFSGDPTSIQLVFRGRVLDDLKQLSDYGIQGGDVLAHTRARKDAHTVPINYAKVAANLMAAKALRLGGQPDPSDYSVVVGDNTWLGAWDSGEDWRGLPPVLVGSTGLTRGDIWQEDDEMDDEKQSGSAAGRQPRVAAVSLLVSSAGNDEGATKRTPASGRKASGSKGSFQEKGRMDSTDGFGEGTDYIAASAADVAEAARRAMISRLKEARMQRQAIVPRSSELLVEFSADDHSLRFGPPSRIFRNIYVAQVGRFMFKVLHRMEGKWTGDAEIHMPGRGDIDRRVCTVYLSFDDNAGVWREMQTLTTSDGLVTSQMLVLRPVADGACRVEFTADPDREHGGGAGLRNHTSSGSRSRHSAFTHSHAAVGTGRATSADYEMCITEMSDSVLVLTAMHASGRPILVETITLVTDYQRVRSVQRFEEDGAFQCLYIIKEERVIDAVSGAVMEPSRMAARRTRARTGTSPKIGQTQTSGRRVAAQA